MLHKLLDSLPTSRAYYLAVTFSVIKYKFFQSAVNVTDLQKTILENQTDMDPNQNHVSMRDEKESAAHVIFNTFLLMYMRS